MWIFNRRPKGQTDLTDSSSRWREYYRRTGDRAPRATLLFALDRFERPGFAVDLGCGGGRDTVEMLRRGWRVLAVDAEAAALEELNARPDLEHRERLSTEQARFEDFAPPRCDLINASFALPLCAPDSFPALWRRIVDAIEPGGRFAGQLYGERDDWAERSGITTLRRDRAEGLLEDFAVELFDEEEEDSVTPRGRPKHWHIFHVVARRVATDSRNDPP
jgi:tellurite methyltransferase